MPDLHQVVEFLSRYDSINVNASPWPSYGPADELYAVDWKSLSQQVTSGSLVRLDEPYETMFDVVAQNQTGAALVPDREVRQRVIAQEIALHEAEWDICAWYQPVHFFGYDAGIYIREEEIVRQAAFIAAYLPDPFIREKLYDLFRISFLIFFLHEHYHHKIECLGLRLHAIKCKSSYLTYFREVYKRLIGSDHQLEEALANADSYHRLGDKPYTDWIDRAVITAAREYLNDRFPLDPSDYRMATKYLRQSDFDVAENELQAQFHEGVIMLEPDIEPDDWNIAPRMLQSFF